MAKISTYPVVVSFPNSESLLIGTDTNAYLGTRNFKISDILGLSTKGTFFLNTNQTTSAINTPIPINFSSYAYLKNMGLTNFGYGATALQAYVGGVFSLSFSLQFFKITSGDVSVDIWIRVNGANIAGSNRTIVVKGNTLYTIANLNYMVSLADEGYVEIYYSSPDLGVSLNSSVSTGVHPSGNAAIAVITQI